MPHLSQWLILVSVERHIYPKVAATGIVPARESISRRASMNKTELTAAVAQKAGLSKSDAAKVLGAFFETVSEELSKGQAVQIIGFGNFEVADYKARTGRNPQTGAVLEIPAGKRPKFTAGSALKKAVAG
ncbi:HU family DNA-binding protein [Sutterella wadsworthensis]|uniref:HU family DNA-binding protein n=1 Tax=Sutterella wadsworthensis TaxID=40545 RepID=UPI003BAB5F0C